MLLIRHINNFSLAELFKSGCVATIGNFDGLHKGHQTILNQVKSQAELMELPSVVITFEPLPREYFGKKDNTQVRLTRFKEKWSYLEREHIQIFVCLHFNKTLAKLSAEAFVADFLIKKLNIKHLIVGHDFQFGCHRAGNLEFLTAQAKKYHFDLDVAPITTYQNQRISSTWVREALQDNNLALTERLLGRAYSLLGKVIHGDKRAREWGIPTANINVHRSIISTILPIKGVYAVKATIKGRDNYNLYGVGNVGSRPTVGGLRNLLEVHLLNFQGDIYGQIMEVYFLHKIRDEKRFDSIDLLKQQILDDVETAKNLFKIF